MLKYNNKKTNERYHKKAESLDPGSTVSFDFEPVPNKLLRKMVIIFTAKLTLLGESAEGTVDQYGMLKALGRLMIKIGSETVTEIECIKLHTINTILNKGLETVKGALNNATIVATDGVQLLRLELPLHNVDPTMALSIESALNYAMLDGDYDIEFLNGQGVEDIIAGGTYATTKTLTDTRIELYIEEEHEAITRNDDGVPVKASTSILRKYETVTLIVEDSTASLPKILKKVKAESIKRIFLLSYSDGVLVDDIINKISVKIDNEYTKDHIKIAEVDSRIKDRYELTTIPTGYKVIEFGYDGMITKDLSIDPKNLNEAILEFDVTKQGTNDKIEIIFEKHKIIPRVVG